VYHVLWSNSTEISRWCTFESGSNYSLNFSHISENNLWKFRQNQLKSVESKKQLFRHNIDMTLPFLCCTFEIWITKIKLPEQNSFSNAMASQLVSNIFYFLILYSLINGNPIYVYHQGMIRLTKTKFTCEPLYSTWTV